MPPHLSTHEPVLVNLLGHSAGALIFGIFLVLLIQDRSRLAPRVAAGLAFLWNLCSLIVLAMEGVNEDVQHLLVIAATGALSLLPAVLLDISLEGRLPWASKAGYLLSAAALVLHASEVVPPGVMPHSIALWITAAGFAVLTLVTAALEWRIHVNPRRALASMALLLFALSFSHFEAQGSLEVWPGELLIHHAGIPLALFVLLQDYRFLLLDAFLRFLTNALLAGLFVLGVSALMPSTGLPERERGLLLIGAFSAFVLYGFARSWVQRLLTSLIFRRTDPARVIERLRAAPVTSEDEYLQGAAVAIGQYFGAEVVAQEKAEARFVVRSGGSPEHVFGLSRRAGGRRYLSEDLDVLSRFAAEAAVRLESHREAELKQLVAQAELRALQSQIHPHFLFNALNTLYGLIPKESSGARRTVLDLADILRFFFRTGSAEVPLEEEIRIVKAYLAIESLRLGEKLQYDVTLPAEALHVPIPVLTVQPLVENAVRHGVASRADGGRLQVRAEVGPTGLAVSVEDDGPGFPGAADRDARPRVGLDNVRQRLRLRYGEDCPLRIESVPGRTVVSFLVPVGEQR